MSACEECHGALGCLGRNTIPCAKCKKLLCSDCSGKYALIPFDATKPNDQANDILAKGADIQSFCKTCFEETSLLDFSKTFDIINAKPVADNENGEKDPITFIFVHGGGATRALYRPHAEQLAEKGYRSILLDLPGHGSLNQTKLTLDACVETVQSVMEECNLVGPDEQEKNTSKLIYVGASLGAYTGFYVLSKLSDFFSGAVLLDCGQNVGPDASFKAKAGLWFLKTLTNHMSNKSLMNAMLAVSKKSKANYKLVETTFGVGMFFQQGTEQVHCLHSIRPADYIPTYPFPILFFNGTEDYRDSENKWLELCKHKELSELKTYEGGDHFFSHDSRFMEDMLERIETFASKV